MSGVSTLVPLHSIYKTGYTAIQYRLRTFAGGHWADHCRPTEIGFMMTNLCNARCVHCDIWKNKGKEAFPTPAQYNRVLTDLREWLGPVHVYLSGGEALLLPYATDVLAHGARVGLFMEMLTHGYWEDQGRIEKAALADPWRLTVSVDAASDTHNIIRGREKFFDKTMRTIETLVRVRKEKGLGFQIRLKTVIMAQNMDEVQEVARFASSHEGMDVFYQAVEQNYNTPEDPRWFEHSENWPKEPERAIAAVNKLIALKKEGLRIGNSMQQLESMIPYFRDPDAMRVAMQSHTAHEHKPICSALTTIQLQANGDVITCYGRPPVGNIKTTPIQQIWENRPRWWREGCCLNERCTTAEKELLSIGNAMAK